MRIAVIVSDANHVVHVGGEIERTVRSFECPPDLAAYLAKHLGAPYVSVSLAIDYQPPQGDSTDEA